MGLSNITLVKIGAIGGVATVTMGLLFKAKLISNVRATEYYKDALKTLRSHQQAVSLLGEPIKDRAVAVEDEKRNYTKENTARYEVPVKGSKQKGTLYFLAERESPNHSWITKHIVLELADDQKKKIIIK